MESLNALGESIERFFYCLPLRKGEKMFKPLFTKEFREKIFNKYNGFCFYCGVELQIENLEKRTYLTIDHLLPQSKDGGHDENNLVPCCKTCNSSKRNKTLDEYRQYYVNKTDYGKAIKHLQQALLYDNIPSREIIENIIKAIKDSHPEFMFFGEYYEEETEL
jgi:hypothetical protein